MQYSVANIARMITEDPDIFCDDVLLEAAASTYLNYFKNSRVPALKRNSGNAQFDQKVREVAAQHFDLDSAEGLKQVADKFTLSMLPPELKLALIERVQAIVDPTLARYEQYFIRQVASGFLPVNRIEEDSGRLNTTVKLFLKFSRKAIWDGPKDILKFPDWRVLERKVIELENNHIEYTAASESAVLFRKSYVNNVMSLLLGGPPEVTTYWLRTVDSSEDACAYGKGTSWCTSTSAKYFQSYYDNAGGMYIIEMQTPTVPRRPIFQIAGNERMNREDIPVTRFGPRLANFIRDALEAVPDKLRGRSREVLSDLANGLALDRSEEEF